VSFALRRIAISLAMLVVTSMLVFVVLRALPGDPVIARLGTAPGMTEADLNRLRAEAGLDQPLMVQYLHWITGFFNGDLGESYFNKTAVTTLLAERLPPTLELTLLSIGLSVLIAVPAGVLAARRPGGFADRVVTLCSSAGMAFPPFVVGIGLILVFSVRLGLFPARGYTPFTEDPVANIHGMVLPSIALAAAAAPLIVRHLRGGLIEAVNSSYARTAEGKGASTARIVWRHALRNASLPSLTMVGLVFGYTLGGSVIIEYMFGIAGIGSLAVESSFRRDYAVLQSVVLLASALFIVVSLVIDLLVWRLDPRLRRVHG
jgi:peptide/nickel transport system permease protein